MQNPELFVHHVNAASEDKLYADLVSPFLDDGKDKISPYRLRHLIPSSGENALAVFELDHSILAAQFYLGDELLVFGDGEPVQFMSVDEIKLVRELGEVAVDGTLHSIESVMFNLVDGPMECQHMVVFNLANT